MKNSLQVSMSGFETLQKKQATLFKKQIKQVLLDLGLEEQILSVHLCDDAEMKSLNRRFRRKNKATDVLSFESNVDGAFAIPVLGDIVISVETAQRQADELGHDLSCELIVLFVHGLLHVLGYDHERSEEEALKQAEAEMFLLSGLDVPVEIALVAR